MLQLIPVVETLDLGWTDPETGIAGLYRINRLSKAELPAIIDEHLRPLAEGGQTIEDSCPFLGGLMVVVDGRLKLGPQCCGDLSDIADWFRLAEDTFSEAYICTEGHPCPYVKRQGDALTILCTDEWKDEWEQFAAGTEPELAIQRSELLEALALLRKELEQFCATLDELSDRYGVERLSRILVAVGPGA
ncbi:MAG TPA: hypothetical protein VF789_05845 [Thermoanaerobaculia bacterium]